MVRSKKEVSASFFVFPFLFSGCSSLNTSEATRLVTNLWQARAGVPAPTAEKLAQIAHLQVTFENGASIFLALGRVNPDNSLTWVSAEGALLTTLNLRPVSSAGWSVNLDQVQPLSADPVAAGTLSQSQTLPFYYRVDVSPADYRLAALGEYRHLMTGEFQNTFGAESVEVFEETWQLKDLGFNSVNRYQVATSGAVLAADVQLHPDFPRLKLSLASYGAN